MSGCAKQSGKHGPRSVGVALLETDRRNSRTARWLDEAARKSSDRELRHRASAPR